jgi:hypothetical protein
MLSPKTSRAKALVRFSRYRAAQEAALEEIEFKEARNTQFRALARPTPGDRPNQDVRNIITLPAETEYRVVISVIFRRV